MVRVVNGKPGEGLFDGFNGLRGSSWVAQARCERRNGQDDLCRRNQGWTEQVDRGGLNLGRVLVVEPGRHGTEEGVEDVAR